MADIDSVSDTSTSEQSGAFEEDNLTRQMEVNGNDVRPSGQNSKLTCHNCTRVFRSTKTLQRHVRENSGCQAFRCLRCNVVCGTKMAIIRHYDRKHQEHKDDILGICPKQDAFEEKRALAAFQDANLVCYICFQLFRSGSSLRSHLNLKHQTQALASCLRCGVVTGYKNIKKHYRSKHPEHVQDVDEIHQKLKDDPSNDELSSKCFSCLRCSFQTEYRNNMFRHYRQRHPENMNDLEQPEHQNTKPSLNSLSCLRCTFHTKFRNNMFRHYRRRHPENVNDLGEIKRVEIPEANKVFDPLIYISCLRCSHYTKYKNNLCRHYKRVHPQHLDDIKQIPRIPLKRRGKRMKKGAVLKWNKGTTDDDWKPRKPRLAKSYRKNPKDVEPPMGVRRSERRRSCQTLLGRHSLDAGSCGTCRMQHDQTRTEATGYPCPPMETDRDCEPTGVASPGNSEQDVTPFAKRRPGRPRKSKVPSGALDLDIRTCAQGDHVQGVTTHLETECSPMEDQRNPEHEPADIGTPRNLDQNVKRHPGRPRKGIPRKKRKTFTALQSDVQTIEVENAQASPQADIQTCAQGAHIKTKNNESNSDSSQEMEATLLDIQTALVAIQTSHQQEDNAETDQTCHDSMNLAPDDTQAATQQGLVDSHLSPDEPQMNLAIPAPVHSPTTKKRIELTPDSVLRDVEIPAWGEVVVSSQAPRNQKWSNTIQDHEPLESPQIVSDGESSDQDSNNVPISSESINEVRLLQIAKEGKLTKVTETVTWTTFHAGCKVKERQRVRIYEIQDG